MSNAKILKIKAELKQIAEKNNGRLLPEDVVNFAKNKKTALHGQFVWNNDKAAEKYRLYQASHIIRSIKVEIVANRETDKIVSVREYVSLPRDRGEPAAGGYREITEILSEDELRLEYIDSVQKELRAFQNKLRTISELAYKKSEAVDKEVEKEKRALARKIYGRPQPTV
jgi:DNA-binding transcriptional MerR regulator